MATNPADGGADGGGKAGVASEPGSGGGNTAALKSVAGLTAVAVGLVALTLIAILGMSFVSTDNPSVVAIATGSFTRDRHDRRRLLRCKSRQRQRAESARRNPEGN